MAASNDVAEGKGAPVQKKGGGQDSTASLQGRAGAKRWRGQHRVKFCRKVTMKKKKKKKTKNETAVEKSTGENKFEHRRAG